MKQMVVFIIAGMILCQPAAASVRGKIEGLVKDESGLPMEGAEVSIVSLNMPSRRFELKSSEKGAFTQIGLWPDFYRVTTKKEGYIPASVEIRIRVDETRKLEITLHKAEEVILNQLSKADQHFMDGNKLMEKGLFDEAVKEYQKATELGETQWAYFFNLGLANKKAGQTGESIKAFTKAVELNPESFSCNKELAEGLAQEKNFAEARTYYAKAVELNSDDPDTNYNYGLVLMSEGESQAALEAFQRAVAGKEDFAEAYYQMGTIFVGQNNQEEAISNLEKFLELSPEHPQAGVARQILDYLKKLPLPALTSS